MERGVGFWSRSNGRVQQLELGSGEGVGEGVMSRSRVQE